MHEIANPKTRMRTPAQVRNKKNKKIKGSLSTHSDLSILFVFDAIGILMAFIAPLRVRTNTAFAGN